jgi:DNA-binding transcriptional ArsR family regulator
MRELMNVTRALGDESRVRIIAALRGGELCVCQVVMLLGLAPSTVSKHLSILRMAGLIEARKLGRWVYYALPAKAATPAAQSGLSWILRQLENEPAVIADDKRLAKIQAMDPEELCRVLCEPRPAVTSSIRR